MKANPICVGIPVILATSVLAIGGAIFCVNRANQSADTALNRAGLTVALAAEKEQYRQQLAESMTRNHVVIMDGVAYEASDNAIGISSADGSESSQNANNRRVISIDGVEYTATEATTDSDTDNPTDVASQPSFVGDEYVVVDINGDVVYLVQKGDTLSEISGYVAFSVDELAEYNHIANVDLIYEGESLRIPARW